MDGYLCLDMGASLTKGFYATGSAAQQVPTPLMMGAQVSGELHPSEIDAHLSLISNADSAVSAWLKVGDELRAVGQLAENFGGESYFNELKESRAIYKILAAVGVVYDRSVRQAQSNGATGFSKQPFKIRLIVMLPMGEWDARKELKAQIQAVKSFYFRGKPVDLEWVSVEFRPEGFGVALYQMARLEREFNEKRSVDPDADILPVNSRLFTALMLGHRNTSLLVFEGTTFQAAKSTSSGPGFLEALQAAIQVSSFQKQDYQKLLEAIRTGETRLVLSGGRVVDVAHAAEVGFNAYWSRLKAFLDGSLSLHMGNRTELGISGGVLRSCNTKELLENYLTQKGCKFTFTEDPGIKEPLRPLIGLNGGVSTLSVRYSDSWATFNWMLKDAARREGLVAARN